MAAITAAPTPPKSKMGKGFYVDLQALLAEMVSAFTDDTSNGTTANTIAELQTYVAAVILVL